MYISKKDIEKPLSNAYYTVFGSTIDEEVEELGLQMIENAGYVLFSQGYNVNDLIDYFSEAKTPVIVEDFVSFAEGHLLLESITVSDEYIEEQFEQLNEIVGKVLNYVRGGVGRVLNAGASNIQKGGGGLRSAAGAMLKSSGRAMRQAGGTVLSKAGNFSKGLMSKAGNLIGRAAPGVGAALYGMDAANRFKKGDWGGGLLSGAGAVTSLVPGAGVVGALAPAGIQMATDAMGLTGDKSRKGNPKPAPKVGPGSAPKPASGAGNVNIPGKGQRYFSSSDKKYYKNYNDALAARNSRRGVTKPAPAAAPARPSAPASSPAPATSAAPARPSASAAPPKPSPTTSSTQSSSAINRLEPYKNLNLDFLSKTNADATNPNTGTTAIKPSGTPPTDTERTTPGSNRRRDINRATGSSKPGSTYEAFDVVFDYLTSEGHVDTLDEALYIMMEMDSETIQDIVMYEK